MKQMKLWSAAAALALLSGPAAAQTVVLDEGSFRVLVGGRPVGEESFSIRQNGSGADRVVIAQGQVNLTGGNVVANVQLEGAGLRPVAYDVELRDGDVRRISGSVTGRRARARTTSPAGESLKEYLVTDGAVLLDDGVAHHYYFVAQRADAGATQVPIMVPRESRQVQAVISAAGTENIEIAGQSVRAQKMTLQPGGGDLRQFWVDQQGRVLRVEIAARNYVAVRTALP